MKLNSSGHQTHALPGGLRQGYAPYRIGTGRYHVRGGNEPDRNGLFATVMNGPVDVAGNRITGVLDEARLSPGMQAALFGQREETGYANPVIVTLDLMP